jgi:hypothetical protein
MKGMNQTLTLIVAASVLMMTALTVMFMGSETLPDVADDAQVSGCQEAISSQCQTSGSSTNTPASCTNDEGEVPENVANQVSGLTASGSVSCEAYN